MRTRMKVAVTALSVLWAATIVSAGVIAGQHVHFHPAIPVDLTEHVVTEPSPAHDRRLDGDTGLPACPKDAPDPGIDGPCVWEDEHVLWMVAGGKSTPFAPCMTEDDPNCIWDNNDLESAERYWVNGPWSDR